MDKLIVAHFIIFFTIRHRRKNNPTDLTKTYADSIDKLMAMETKKHEFFEKMRGEVIPPNECCPICIQDGEINPDCQTCGGTGRAR